MTHEFLAERFPNLEIERAGDGLILLKQNDGDGNIDHIELHPLHVRHLAQTCGLVDPGDPQAARTIATLTRRLHTLRERVGHLAYWLNNLSDSDHADMSYEQTYATATADMADEFCRDFELSADPGVKKPAPLKPAENSQASLL